MRIQLVSRDPSSSQIIADICNPPDGIPNLIIYSDNPQLSIVSLRGFQHFSLAPFVPGIEGAIAEPFEGPVLLASCKSQSLVSKDFNQSS